MIQNLGNKEYEDRFVKFGLGKGVCGGCFSYPGPALWTPQHCGKPDRPGPLLKSQSSHRRNNSMH